MSAQVPAVLTFKHLAERHLDDILAVETEAYLEPWSRNMFREEMHGEHSYFYVAFEGDTLVGYSGFWLVLNEAHITTLVVRKEFRGRGLGRQILAHVLDQARECGAELATLEVRVSNSPARQLYDSFGFHAVGLRKQYYPKTREDAVVMLKEFGEITTA